MEKMIEIKGLHFRYESENGDTKPKEDVLKGILSKESPMGKAILGHRAGDRVLVRVSDDVEYYVVIRSIEKGSDDDSLPIREF